MMRYEIVPMDRSHLESIAALERQCFSAPWSIPMLEEELFNPQASFLVAEGENGQVLGYAGLQVVLDEGYVNNVAVRPEYRRQGGMPKGSPPSCWTCSGGSGRGRAWPSSPWRSGIPTRPPGPSTPGTASWRRAGGKTTTSIPRRMPSL